MKRSKCVSTEPRQQLPKHQCFEQTLERNCHPLQRLFSEIKPRAPLASYPRQLHHPTPTVWLPEPFPTTSLPALSITHSAQFGSLEYSSSGCDKPFDGLDRPTSESRRLRKNVPLLNSDGFLSISHNKIEPQHNQQKHKKLLETHRPTNK